MSWCSGFVIIVQSSSRPNSSEVELLSTMREDRGSGLSRIPLRMFFFSLQSNGKPRVTNISQFFAEIELPNVFENFVKTFFTYIHMSFLFRNKSGVSKVFECREIYNIVTHMVHVISLHMCTYCRVISQNLYSALFIYILTSLWVKEHCCDISKRWLYKFGCFCLWSHSKER